MANILHSKFVRIRFKDAALFCRQEMIGVIRASVSYKSISHTEKWLCSKMHPDLLTHFSEKLGLKVNEVRAITVIKFLLDIIK